MFSWVCDKMVKRSVLTGASLCVVLLAAGVSAITNGNRSEAREDNRRTYNKYYDNVKPFQSNEDAPKNSYYKDPPHPQRNKDTLNLKGDRDSQTSGSTYYDRGYGLYAAEDHGTKSYNFQSLDHGPSYADDKGVDFHAYSGHDFKDHHGPPFHGYIQPHYAPDHHALALKGILLPLAGVALLGAAAALVTNPVLLQLGVISGKKRRRRSIMQDIFKVDQQDQNATSKRDKPPTDINKSEDVSFKEEMPTLTVNKKHGNNAFYKPVSMPENKGKKYSGFTSSFKGVKHTWKLDNFKKIESDYDDVSHIAA